MLVFDVCAISLLCLFLIQSVKLVEDPFVQRHFKPVSIKIESLETSETHNVASIKVKEIKDCYIRDFITADINFPDLNSILEVGTKCVIGTVLPHKEIEWVSFENEKSELKNRKYRKYKVKGKMGDVKYGSRPEISHQPDILVVKWIHNHQTNSSIESVVSEAISREEKTSVKTTHSYGGTITAGFSVPFLKSVSVSVSVSYKGAQSYTEEITAVKTYTLEDTVTVEPESSVKVTWNLIQSETIVDWRAPLYVTGAAAIKFINENTILFLPLGELAKFFKDLSPMENDTYSLYAHVEGVLRSSKGISSTVRTFHFPMNSNSGNLMVGDCPNGITSQ